MFENIDKHKVEFVNKGMGRVNNTPYPDVEYAFAAVWKVTKGYGVLADGMAHLLLLSL